MRGLVRKNKILSFSILIMIVGFVLFFANDVLAQADLNLGLGSVGEGTGLGSQDIRLTIAKIIRAVLGLLGVVAISIMLYGGFVWMTAGGSEEKIGTAKKILINGTIGLVIILSSFSIAQFVINQLGKATGAITDKVPEKCLDEDYAWEHPDECYDDPLSDICDGDDAPDWCCIAELEESDVFVVKSITPVTQDTGMNNVVIRTLFNRDVNSDFAVEDIFTISRGNEDVSDDFTYSYLDHNGSFHKDVIVAEYSGDEVCVDLDTGDGKPCLDFGDYKIEVRGDLTSIEGYEISEETNCGIFPLEADFSIKNDVADNSSLYIEMDGVDSYISVGGEDATVADFTGSFTISSWLYVSEGNDAPYGLNHIISNFTGGTPGAGYALVYSPNNKKLSFFMRTESGQKSVAYNLESLEEWVHVAIVYEENIGATLYINGEPVAITNFVDSILPYNGKLTLGSHGSNANYSFKGKMDEFRIYDRALDLSRIQELSLSTQASYELIDEDGLYLGYHFDEGEGGVLNDYVNDYDAEIFGGVSWFGDGTGVKVIDKQAPSVVDNFGLLGLEDSFSLELGKSYMLDTSLTDDHGLGFYKLSIAKLDMGNFPFPVPEFLTEFYDGPRVERGSDATLEDPYDFSYPFYTPYEIDSTIFFSFLLEVFDIDNNKQSFHKNYLLLPGQCKNGFQDIDNEFSGTKAEDGVDCGGPCPACSGGECVEDWQCSNGNKCIEEMCVPYPQIIDVDPMSGAEGNWVTVTGFNFGEDAGSVEFATDINDDGIIDQMDWDSAILANLVSQKNCGDTWTDNWIIVEVPNDDLLPLESLSSVRVIPLIEEGESVLWDSTTDDFGLKPGENSGLFLKDGTKRPAICRVQTSGGKTAGYPGQTVQVLGSALGESGDESEKMLFFDDIDIPYDSWSNTAVLSVIPDINLLGKVAVGVKVSNRESNKVPFTIKLPDDSDLNPKIDSIDPIVITPGSYITISGSGFGNFGRAYISGSAIRAQTCAEQTNTDINSDGIDDCYALDLSSFPAECGNTWTENSIIAKVSVHVPMGEYYLALKNNFDYFTPGVGVDGLEEANPLQVEDGEPMPGICKIEPNSGPAPQLFEPISIYGDNFVQDDPIVYFWKNTASSSDLNSWLSSSDDFITPNDPLVSVEENKIKTFIPYSETDGASMQSGPIKISVADQVSNGVNYIVNDCREAGDDLKSEMEINYQCCGNEGPDQGRWKPKDYVCTGETRNAGYVWRFSSGEINTRPKVVEQCDWKNWLSDGSSGQYPSPTPSLLWPTGENACLNSTIALKFNTKIKSESINEQTVKIYECGQEDQPVCEQAGVLSSNELNFILSSSNILELRKIPPVSSLKPNTWYHVELYKDILSDKQVENLGELALKEFRLQATRPCDDFVPGNSNTAYCFDFKTGDSDCELKSAGIVPNTYTTYYLGKLFDPDGVPPNPLYYFIWGLGEKECIVLSPEIYDWDWETKSSVFDINFIPGKDTKATITALKETSGTEIKASTGNSLGEKIEAVNTTAVVVKPPSVVDYAPNCTQACINSSVWVEFDRPMVEETYENNLQIVKCKDGETCQSLEWLSGFSISEDSTDRILKANLPVGIFLEPDTWYRVAVVGGNNGVRAVGSLVDNILGKGMEENFIWKFRTKDDPSPCLVDKVKINPEIYTAKAIGEKTKYTISAYSSPDQCSSLGQEVNPWNYGWDWQVGDNDVVRVSDFSFVSKINSDCKSNCTLKGSDIPREEDLELYLCGNGEVDLGEDCDIDNIIEIPGQSCGYDCLRPGNISINSCGNGEVEEILGEECDPVKNDYCNNDCTWAGASQEFTGVINAPICEAEGTITDGEECFLGEDGCSENCLHLGTQLAQSWCDEHPDTVGCEDAISVCGNEIIESGEECEVSGNSLMFLTQYDGVLFNSIEIDNAINYCNENCLLQDICEIEEIPAYSEENREGLRCDNEDEWCHSDCTLIGSSVMYNQESLCGDNQAGDGEFGGCELDSDDDSNFKSNFLNPVQRTTAVGLGEVDEETKQQYSSITATIKTYFAIVDEKKIEQEFLPSAQSSATGDYYIKCGYEEFTENKDSLYNNCPFNLDEEQNKATFGVAENSCCYERSYRIDEYPADGQGLSDGDQPVCPNTAISFDFNGEIDPTTIEGNYMIAIAYPGLNYDCSAIGGQDVTKTINNSLPTLVDSGEKWWQKLWHKIKGWLFALVGGENIYASEYPLSGDYTWCNGLVDSTFVVDYEKDGDEVLSSKLKINLTEFLPFDTHVSVYFQGGQNGIKTIDGIGVRAPDPSVDLYDSILFKTGSEICKISNVEIDPDYYLFNQPYTTALFSTVIKSDSGQELVSIPEQYEWETEWQPQNNAIVNIPQEGYEPEYTEFTPTTIFGVNNLSGTVVAVANVFVTEDNSPGPGNQKDKVFTGITKVEVNFCENPWPARDDEGIWKSFEDNEYNFSFSYCADSGLSGETIDDFPYLDVLSFSPEEESEIEENLHIADDILKRYIFFNDKNEDVIGVQIFKNLDEENKFSADGIVEWYISNFDNFNEMQQVQIAGYNALPDGRNYYINALNETEEGNIYSNIYLFSVNKDAGAETLQVFEKILNSLQFNINITDYGYCLSDVVEDDSGLPSGDQIHAITNKQCSTDFDCRDLSGLPEEGTNGVCSNAKTKMFRDMDRLPEIGLLQLKISSENIPNFKSGTYLPGYTNSRWPSWSTFGIQDEINSWVGCEATENTDAQTCWDAEESIYYCPYFSSVFEYKYNEDESDYMLHGPMEYFNLDSDIVNYFIDPTHYDNQPWCQAEQSYSPFGEKCGDGVVQSGEECDPPGKSLSSDWGVVSVQEEEGCSNFYKNQDLDNTCAVDLDCGFELAGVSEGNYYTDSASVCTLSVGTPKILYDLGWEKSVGNADESQYFIGCSQKDDCLQSETYTNNIYKGLEGEVGITSNYYVPGSELSDWLIINEANIDCTSIEELYPDSELKSVKCNFIGDVNYGWCDELDNNYQASKICNNSCQWDYSSCESTTECGNGLVEANEICDDGALNGTYGHCADENSIDIVTGQKIGACQGLHNQFCGNNIKDYVDNNNNGTYDEGVDAYLEFCDKSMSYVNKGYCSEKKDLTCNSDSGCDDVCLNSLPSSPYTCRITGGQCNSDDDCLGGDFGPCLALDDEYNYNKENTCSWDCQDYGAYCGDGILQPDYEECDDGNEENQDGCSNDCLKENIACLSNSKTVIQETNFGNTAVNIAYSPNNDGNFTSILQCFENTNGDQICAAGLSQCEEVLFNYQSSNVSCVDDLTSYSEDLEGLYTVICSNPFVKLFQDQDVFEGEEQGNKYCGNGIVETYTGDNGEEFTEVCDMGASNGLKCIPEYNKSCTYCSYDCKEILTVDSNKFCGNGEIDYIKSKGEFEKCETKDDGTIIVFEEGEKICPDKGNYYCLNECMDISDDCIDCNIKIPGGDVPVLGARPKVKLLNAVTPSDYTLNWPEDGLVDLKLFYEKYNNKSAGSIILKNGELEKNISVKNKGLGFISYEAFGTEIDKENIEINVDPRCNGEDGHYMVQLGSTDGRKFSFPVYGDTDLVGDDENEVERIYIFSPPAQRPLGYEEMPLDSIFRIVLTWTNTDWGGEFQGIVQNDDILEGEVVYYSEPESNDNFSNELHYPNLNYFKKNNDNTTIASYYFHEQGSISGKKVQSFTIDTEMSTLSLPDPKTNYRFLVEAIGEAIFPYKNTNDLKVEVYNTHDDPLTLYEPDYTFEIKDAGGSNPSAQYWYVFDLEKKDEKFEVVEKQQIETGWCQILGVDPLECENN